MNQQDRIVLNGLYKNASMGWDATCTILPKAEQEKLRTELCKQLEYYKEQKHAAETQLQKACAIPKEQGAMAKLCADLSPSRRRPECRCVYRGHPPKLDRYT